MPSAPLTTYRDLIDHVTDWLGADPTGEVQRAARRAALAGTRALASAHRWAYYYQRGRLATAAPYSAGAVTYAQAARAVSLSGGSFPAWAPYGSISIRNVVYQAASNPDPATLVLSACSNPGLDVADPQAYTLSRDTYPLPADCQAIDRMILVNNAFALWYDHPGVWLERQRVYRGPAAPRSYTIRGDPHYFGVMAVSFFPPPDAAYQLDFLYQRSPRPLVVDAYSAGTASVSAGSAEYAGSGTAWSPAMVGSVLRLGNAVNAPTGPPGPFPAVHEGVILSVGSATSLSVDTPSPVTQGRGRYVISDPVDVEPGSMLTALLRACEHQTAVFLSRKDADALESRYGRALVLAREADSRNFALEAAGGRAYYPYRLAQMPAGPDVS